MAQVSALGKKFGFAVVEDATESLGSYYLTGKLARRHTGTIGELGVYSFNGNKIITTGGGGMIVCSDAGLARSARYLTTQAKDNPVKYVHNEIGYNFRLSNLQAAMGVAQLQTLERRIQAKRRNYRLYERLLAGIPGISLMAVAEGTRANYWLYAVLVDKKLFGMDKDGLMQRLAKAGIEARPLWMPNHLQKPYRGCEAYRLEQAVSLWKKVLNFPSSPQLSAKEIEYICATVRRIHKDGKR
jgi:perosamine synthetase